MQGHKSESSALDEIQNARSRCVATVADCSRRQDRKRRTHVVRNQHVFVGWCTDFYIICYYIRLHGWWLHESTLSVRQIKREVKLARLVVTYCFSFFLFHFATFLLRYSKLFFTFLPTPPLPFLFLIPIAVPIPFLYRPLSPIKTFRVAQARMHEPR